MLDMVYSTDGLPFTELVEAVAERNRENLQRAIGEDINTAEVCLDRLYAIASHFFPWFSSLIRADLNPVTRLLLPILHKSLVSLGTALFLTSRGMYGPARPLLRHVFESVVIGKFCSVRHESDVFDRWMDGYDIRLARDVFDRFRSPSPDRLREMWRELSGYTHSSIFASQHSLGVREEKALTAVWWNLTVSVMLTECLYHLLSSHLVTRSVRYYQSYYGDKDAVSILTSEFKTHVKRFKGRLMTRDATAFVATLRSKWTLE